MDKQVECVLPASAGATIVALPDSERPGHGYTCSDDIKMQLLQRALHEIALGNVMEISVSAECFCVAADGAQ